jgi:hypothetical protein
LRQGEKSCEGFLTEDGWLIAAGADGGNDERSTGRLTKAAALLIME